MHSREALVRGASRDVVIPTLGYQAGRNWWRHGRPKPKVGAGVAEPFNDPRQKRLIDRGLATRRVADVVPVTAAYGDVGVSAALVGRVPASPTSASTLRMDVGPHRQAVGP